MASISHNTAFVGTLQSNRRDIPIEVKNVAARERFSCQCFWESLENKLVLHSYVFPTKSSGQRNVLLPSTAQRILEVTIDDGKKKPAICKLYSYDFTKAGTDVMEHRIVAWIYLQTQIKSLDFNSILLHIECATYQCRHCFCFKQKD